MEQIEQRLSHIESDVSQKREARRALHDALEDHRKALDEAEKERARLQAHEKRQRKKGAMAGQPGAAAKVATSLQEAEDHIAALHRQQVRSSC